MPPVLPAKLISMSQGFQDSLGAPVANGMLMLTLSQVCTVTSSGGVADTAPIYLTLDANGKIASTAIWFNDELSPSGTIYYGKVYHSNGMGIIPGLDRLQYSITGASFDLATAVQSSSASPSYSGAVLLTPAGNQVITTGNLTLSTGNLVTTAGSITSGGTLSVSGNTTLSGDESLSSGKVIKWNSDTGFSRDSAGVIDVGNGTQGDTSGTVKASVFGMGATGLLTMGSIPNLAGISSATAASKIAFGNGTAGDTTGILSFTTAIMVGKVATYNNIATVSNGVPSILATVDLTAQGANIGATTALTTPAAGMYRLSIYLNTTRVASVSSTQPNVIIQWTDRDNATGQSSQVINSDSSNVLTNARSITFSINCSAASAIQYSTTGYATSGATTMQYALRFKIEAL